MGTEKPLSASAPPLAVRTQGSDRTLPAGPSYTIGRDPKSDIVVNEDRVSWQHAVLKLDRGSWVLEDTGSTNGTYLGSQKVNRITVNGETTVRLGHPADGPELTCSTGAPPRPPTVIAARPVMAASAVPAAPATAAGAATASHREPSVIRQLPTKVLRIGRGPDNDIVVSDLSVSRHHAELRRTATGYQIVDLDSHNGTFVNGQQVGSAPLTEGDIVGIGPSTFRLSGSELQEFVDTGDVSLVARDLTVTLGNGKVLLDHVSFPLGERCLLGIIGPSGAGKSTLLGALTGMRPANGGSVLYDDRDLYAHYAELRHRIGLVPQENILHTQLTARRALRYAAELRFPRDTSKAERNRRVDEVLAELSLTAHAETRTDRLSGGQQKRVNVALELMTKPSLLFLDEPTSGLDPGLDKSVMEMMSGLAKDGRTVIVVTHSVANLDICDRLLVLVPGGKVAYFGPPQDGLKHFGKPGWAEVFQAFDAEPQRDWAGEYRRSAWYQQFVLSAVDGRGPSAVPRQIPPALASKNRLAQFSTLCRRYLSVIASDRVYLGLLVGAPIVLGAVILAIPAQYGLGRRHPRRHSPSIRGPARALNLNPPAAIRSRRIRRRRRWVRSRSAGRRAPPRPARRPPPRPAPRPPPRAARPPPPPRPARPRRVMPARPPRVTPALLPRLRPARKGPLRPARAARPRPARSLPAIRPRRRTPRPRRPPMTRPPRCCSSSSSAPASPGRSTRSGSWSRSAPSTAGNAPPACPPPPTWAPSWPCWGSSAGCRPRSWC